MANFFNFPTNVSQESAYNACQFLNVTRNQKALRWGWEGIPFNVIFNSVIFLNLIFLFGLLRRKAWRTKDLPSYKQNWLHFIYGDREQIQNAVNIVKYDIPDDCHQHDEKFTQLYKFMKENENNLRSIDEIPLNLKLCPSTEHNNNLNKESKTQDSEHRPHEDSSFQNTNLYTSEFGHWVLTLLLIKDSDILKKKGPDAVHYLIFQKYILFFLLILTIICLFVILPVNLSGEVEVRPFAQTTISNIPPNSKRLWVHVSCSFLLLGISLWMMCHFSRIINADTNQYIKRTLLIENVPKKKRTSDALRQYFESVFPGILIDGIQFVYDTRNLKKLHMEYVNAIQAKNYCVQYLEERNRHLCLRKCHIMPSCCPCCPRTDALEYYTNLKTKLEDQLVKEFYSTIGRPLGSVFVTFKDTLLARNVFQHCSEMKDSSWTTTCLIRSLKYCPNRLPTYDVERTQDGLMVNRWEVAKAPYPDEINWADIGIQHRWIWVRRIVVYTILTFFFLFISTPIIMTNMLSYLRINDAISGVVSRISWFSPVFKEFYTPLIFNIFSIILPYFVQYACDYLPYKTMTQKNKSIMCQVFVYLLLMVIILPSLGLTSARALLSKAITNSSQTIQCLFPVDNGAFFVNYVLQSTFITNSVELLRLGELFCYFCYFFIYTKSEAEYEKIRKMVYFDFQFGTRYPRFLLNFCMVVTYSLTCPVIAPCGLFYMTIKHFVDRYNIYYVYNPSKISASIHSTAITFFQIGIVMMLVQMATFIALKTGSSYMTTFSVVILFAALVLFFCQCFCHCCWNIGASLPAKRKTAVSKKDYCSCSYLPPVLTEIDLNGTLY